MAISEELKIAVRVEAKNAIAELNKLKKTTTGNTTAFAGMAKTLIGFGGVTAALLATKRLVIDNIAAGIKYAANLEKQTVAFEVLLGSAGKARELMSDLKELGASTPLQLAGLASNTQALLGFQVAADDVVKTLRMLGDVAMGDQAILDRLVLAYGKVASKGKATLEEINMFSEAGVPLMAELAKQTGVTTEALFKLISTGKIGFDEVTEALKAMTTGEGQFANMLSTQAATLAGVMSTFQDNVDTLRAALVSGLLPVLSDVFEKLTKIMQIAIPELGETGMGGLATHSQVQRFRDGGATPGDIPLIEELLALLDVREAGGLGQRERQSLSTSFFGMSPGIFSDKMIGVFREELKRYLGNALTLGGNTGPRHPGIDQIKTDLMSELTGIAGEVQTNGIDFLFGGSFAELLEIRLRATELRERGMRDLRIPGKGFDRGQAFNEEMGPEFEELINKIFRTRHIQFGPGREQHYRHNRCCCPQAWP